MLIASLLLVLVVIGQHSETKSQLDSLYIDEMEDTPGRPKVLHAEPLYIDLIRDLGARKGEKEWNFGFGLTDRAKFDQYMALVEYEFAPVDRLGLEIEVPVSFYIPYKKTAATHYHPAGWNRLKRLFNGHSSFLKRQKQVLLLDILMRFDSQIYGASTFASHLWAMCSILL